MKCLVEDCNNEFESKTGRRKFCSDSCKMKYFRKHGKKGEINDFKMQVLYNAVLDMVGKINFGTVPTLGFTEEKNGTPIAISHTSKQELGLEKSFQQHINEISELDTEYEYKRKADEIEAATNLSKKQKDLLLLNMKIPKM